MIGKIKFDKIHQTVLMPLYSVVCLLKSYISINCVYNPATAVPILYMYSLMYKYN